MGFTRYRILANVAAITDDGFKVGLEAKGCTYNVSNVDRAVVVVHPNHDKSRTELPSYQQESSLNSMSIHRVRVCEMR